jgi:iron complex outermembrane recepter protein
VIQPSLAAERFSPKTSFSYEPNRDWRATASFGVANRFPTVTELYQVVTAAGIVTNPNPGLRPERALSGELALERLFPDGKMRVSLFQENTRDMLISQNGTVPGSVTITSFLTNVDRVRNRGVELAMQKDNMMIQHLELFGSVTYVDSIILSDPTFVSATTIAVGKHVPNVPMWRWTLGATYRPSDAWAMTVAGRYQSKIFATLDNVDVNPNVYQAFDPFLVVDARLQYKVSARGTISIGIDNIGNAKYHLFHPFPQRTFVVQGRLAL